MDGEDTVPELKEVLGALIFGARHPLSIGEIRKTLVGVAGATGGHSTVFCTLKAAAIRKALEELR